MSMKMPNVEITFSEKAAARFVNGERGIIFMILKGTAPVANPCVIYNSTDIPNGIDEANEEQIKLALVGYQTAPKKVICYFVEGAEGYTEALKYAQTTSFQYLVAPTAETDSKVTDIVNWIKSEREADHKVKAVLPNATSDTEGVINYTTASVSVGDKTYTAEQFCSRIAGIIAGTPLTISATYAPVSEATDCTRLTKKEMDEAVGKGEFFLFWDGEKVKTSRAVNSLVTTTEDKNEQFQKIKIVEVMDSLFDDIKTTIEDSYLGKYANTYSNKCLLISAINVYLQSLVDKGILNKGEVEIDVNAVRTYLISKGVDVSNMEEEEIKRANTGSKVFLSANVSILDAIEDIVMPISI